MRRIADVIEYTPGAIYSYFKDKNEICFALHTRGFEKLNAMTAEALAGLSKRVDPIERLRVIGRTYIRFALENRSLYDLMFISKKTGELITAAAEWLPGQQAFGTLRETVQMIITKYELDWDPDVTAFMCWSSVHGCVSLVLCERCTPLGEIPPEKLIDAAQSQFIDMIKARAKSGR